LKPRALILTFLLLAATGCKLGPNYHRPQIAVPDQFRNAPPVSGTSSIADTKWFDLFQDDALKQLVTTALANNFDLRIAAERVLEARAQYGITRAGLFPTVDGQAQFTATRSSSVGFV
jgi:outer membrane protein TolC